ncbi:MAG: hypothetical protein IJU86_00205, partial [Firmicutes bacterium]|nr:hypothetical protein [Bacillota bacterium]
MEKKINVHGIKINPKDIQQFLLKEGVKDDINSIGMLISFNTQRLGYIKISPKTKKIFSNTKETWDKTERKHLSSFLENQKQIEISSSPRNIITKLNLSFYKKDEQDKKIPYENLVLTLCKDDEENLYYMYKNSNSGIPVAQAKKNKQENKNNEIQVAQAEENKMENKIDVRKIIVNLKDIKKFLINKGVWQDAYSIPMIIFLNNKKEVQHRNLRDLLQDREQMEISPSFGGIIQELKVSFNCYDKNNRCISCNKLVLILCKDDKEKLYFTCENINAGIQVIQADRINARKITINLVDIKNFLTREGVNDDIDSIYMLMSFNNKKGMQGEKLSDLLKHQKSIEIYSGFYNTIKELEMSFYREDEKGNRIPYDKLVLT